MSFVPDLQVTKVFHGSRVTHRAHVRKLKAGR